jgi:hypothetical protein
MSGFFEEVKRRKVYRVAAAYIIAAGFIIQIGSAVFPAWELPNWAFRLVVVLLLIGFPIALILAWAYDVTPQGIRATPAPATPGSHRRRNLIMLIAIGVIISAGAGFFLLPRASARKIDKSIAKLQPVSLSVRTMLTATGTLSLQVRRQCGPIRTTIELQDECESDFLSNVGGFS